MKGKRKERKSTNDATDGNDNDTQCKDNNIQIIIRHMYKEKDDKNLILISSCTFPNRWTEVFQSIRTNI